MFRPAGWDWNSTRSRDDLPGSLLVGVEDETGQTHFAGVNVRYRKEGTASAAYLGAAFGGPAEQILESPGLKPRFNAHSLRLEYAVPQRVLEHWVDAGILVRNLSDRLKVCPRCDSLPTFRDGCRQCSSARVQHDQLIHHFACAHVDLANKFQQEQSLVCPKCRTDRLVAGADFEYLRGECRCQDCQWHDTLLDTIGHCLKCDHRFAAEQARVQDVHVYRANKLHWQQLIDRPAQITWKKTDASEQSVGSGSKNDGSPGNR